MSGVWIEYNSFIWVKEKRMKEKPVKYFCHLCVKLVEPIRIGRAHYECPLCHTNMTIDMVYQMELANEDNLNSIKKLGGKKR